MRRFTSARPSPAMAVAFVALLAALSGTAVALPGTNTVDSGDIKRGAVKGADLGRNAVTSAKVKNNSLTGSDVKNLTGADVTDSSLTGADIQDDSLAGADVNESTLAKVPSATTADTAASAGSVANLKTVGVTTIEEGAAAVTLFQHGPLTVTGNCEADGVDTVAAIRLTTTEDGSAFAANDDSDGSFGPADGAQDLQTATDAAGADPTTGLGYDDTVTAFSPGGRAFNGVISPWADASAGASGQCKFHGHIVLTG